MPTIPKRSTAQSTNTEAQSQLHPVDIAPVIPSPLHARYPSSFIHNDYAGFDNHVAYDTRLGDPGVSYRRGKEDSGLVEEIARD